MFSQHKHTQIKVVKFLKKLVIAEIKNQKSKMNRIYVLSNDGRIFFAEPSSNSFELLDYIETSGSMIKTKRLSSSPWCFWSITSKFRVKLFVYLLDTPLEHQEITFENKVSQIKPLF